MTYNLGSTTQRWANVFTQTVRASQDTDAAEPALHIDANDIDEVAVVIDGEQETVNVFRLDADSLTTGSAMSISETSASALDRKTLSIIQNNAAATNAVAVDIVSTGGRKALHIDKNHSATGAASGTNAVKGIDLDLDQSAGGTLSLIHI